MRSRIKGIIMYQFTFNTGHALPLAGTRILRPRSSRGEVSKRPRNMNCSCPITRHLREHEHAMTRSQSRFIHVHEQSTSACSPRQQTRQQRVRARDQRTVLTSRATAGATDTIQLRSARRGEMSTSEASTRLDLGRDSDQAANRPRFHLAVVRGPDTCFPVHIRRILSHDLV